MTNFEGKKPQQFIKWLWLLFPQNLNFNSQAKLIFYMYDSGQQYGEIQNDTFGELDFKSGITLIDCSSLTKKLYAWKQTFDEY